VTEPVVHDLAGPQVGLAWAAAQSAADALEALATRATGLTDDEVAARREQFGANALRSHGARPVQVLVRQLRNPLLLLLLAAALVSGGTGNRADALIITVIVALSVGLGFFNEYRSEQAVEELHSKIRHNATVIREAKATLIDVANLVPGDIVALKLGDIVPADMRLLSAHELECDEAILTGESLPAVKTSEPAQGESEFASCALMGTIVSQGSGSGVVVQTGASTAFGRIAVGLGERHAQTSFQIGLQQFSMFLVKVAGILTAAIFVINIVLHKPVLDALLFSLAIAIGLTPQLLPAIVTVSLSRGTRRLAAKKVLVKRLVAIEDLGNITTLFTDKTGTLTEGRVTFERSLGPDGVDDARVHLLGLVCNEATVTGGRAVSGNQLDVALWDSAGALAPEASAWIRQDAAPFDHERRFPSVGCEG
jgi:P-type Mg2+ transporter